MRPGGPHSDPDFQRVRLLEIPFVWFAVQVAEWLIVGSLLWYVVPHSWPAPAIVAVWVLALAALTSLNVAIRRRFVPH
jgi:hypothetical protein